MQCKLYVTSSRNLQLTDNVQRRSTEHLILFISKGLGRSYYNTVTGMDADRIDIFHVTYGNTVSCTVAHNFVLDFFPAADTSFYQNLSDTGKTQTVFQNALKLCQIMCDTSAGTAQCISRTKNYRVTDLCCYLQTMFYIFYNVRRCNRLTDLFHGLLEHLTVFCFFNGKSSGTDEAHIVLL